MAAALFIQGHVQCPGAWLWHRRHDDLCRHGALSRGSSPQLPNLGMEKCSVRLRESELVFRVRRACLSSPCTARHDNAIAPDQRPRRERSESNRSRCHFDQCIFCVLLHLSVRTPTVAGRSGPTMISGIARTVVGTSSLLTRTVADSPSTH